jgi:YHS domain-containing protein
VRPEGGVKQGTEIPFRKEAPMPIIDPVSNEDIDDVEYPERADYNGYTYAFASMDNYHKFQENPEKYADPAKAVDDKEE